MPPETPHNYHYSESYLAESERRLNNLTVGYATLQEKGLSNDKILTRLEVSQTKIELLLAEVQATLQKLSSFNDSSTLSIEKLVDNKLEPLKEELAARKEEVVKLKTMISVVASVVSFVFVTLEIFHDHILSWLSK
jgi:peptidoglycan hydrolase CwlO-like protein